jgi:hypothetical protein
VVFWSTWTSFAVSPSGGVARGSQIANAEMRPIPSSIEASVRKN